MSDELLEFLGNAFVAKKLHERGWTFEEFIYEYEIGIWVTVNI